MRRKSVRAVLLCLAAVTILATAAVPAQAVVGGTPDDTNVYNNVGVIMMRGLYGPGLWSPAGTCTLVENDAEGIVVVTAAHVLEGANLDDLRVIFDPATEYGAEYGATPLPDGVPWPFVYFEVNDCKANLDYVPSTAYLGNAKKYDIGLGKNDVALMWLGAYVPDNTSDPLASIAPAPIVGLGGLSALDLKRQTFTVVGYGVNDYPVGSFASWRNPNSVTTWSGRNFAAASVVPADGPYADSYLKLTSSVSNADSGGPLFFDDGTIRTIAALHVRADSRRFDSPCYDYRLDTASAQEFLRANGIIP
jgi:Trypsin-like peptidase domain